HSTRRISDAIMKGFAKTEEEVVRYTKDRNDASGSCAVVVRVIEAFLLAPNSPSLFVKVILVQSHVFVADLGDSRAVIGRRKAGSTSPFVERKKGRSGS